MATFKHEIVFGRRVVFLLMCFQALFSASLSNDETGADEPCKYHDDNLGAVCKPCAKKNWIEMVKPNSGLKEQITNAEHTCYNSDPITQDYGEEHPLENDLYVTMAVGKYYTTAADAPHDFLVRRQGFFRYAYTNEKDKEKTEVDMKIEEKNLDLYGMSKYYKREKAKGASEDFKSDFQLVEWPGRTAKDQQDALTEDEDAKKDAGCQSKSDADPCKKKYHMLNFQRDNGKIQFYPCNAQEGTNIVAVGAIEKIDKEEQEKKKDYQKMWLSHGRESIYHNYIQPMFMLNITLELMAKNPKKSDEDKSESGTRTRRNTQDGKGKLCGPGDRSLRIVRDFAFTKGRLVLGMECGIVVVSSLDKEQLEFHVADLTDETGIGKNLFPDPVNKISASTCCFTTCSTELVAAYSYKVDRKSEDNKFLYISFNLGDNFEKKIISSKDSPVNLIKGLYKLYEKWDDYYQIMNEPDEEDLKEDEEFNMANIRKKQNWDTTTTREKERLFGITAPKEEKLKVQVTKVVEMLEKRVPRRKTRLEKAKGSKAKFDLDRDRTPEWVRYVLTKSRSKAGWNETWTDDNCDANPTCKEKFENDKAVDWLLNGSDIHVKTAKRDENEPFCKEITSLLVLPEERHIMALCEVGYERNKAGDKGRSNVDDNGGANSTGDSANKSNASDDSSETKYLALYNFPVKNNIPMIHGSRVSQRIFACKYMENNMYENDTTKWFKVLPEVIRLPGSSTILVMNCHGVIYMSTNFGNTLFNVAFYYEKEVMEEYCKEDTSHKSNPPKPCLEKDKEEKPNYIRSFKLCALNVPPIITADRSATVMLLSFGRFYARGAIAYNREARLIVGDILKGVPYDRRFETLMFPGLSSTGEAVLSVNLKQVYSLANKTAFKKTLYKGRPGLRLVQLPFQFHSELKHYHSQNQARCRETFEKRFGFPTCKTISFFVHPRRLRMDIGEKEDVRVQVRDDNPELPLWIFSSNEKSVVVKANSFSKGTTDLNSHNWNVEIKSIPNNKTEEESLVDAFYGSDYNKLNDYSTQISLVNTPTARCHVQPSSTVTVNIGCKGKRLVAHEDAHRPQCSLFRENFNYTLKKGEYDPKMADYWLHKENLTKPFVTLLPNGDLSIIYDYSRWGCPLEPFRPDEFIPDLRILTDGNRNSAEGKRFEGKFILIELFGAKGFSYTKTVGDAKSRCKRYPQYLKDLHEQWKIRQRLFSLAKYRLRFPNNTQEMEFITSKNLSKIVNGNAIFHNMAVKEHLNIWNRANFLRCDSYFEDEVGKDVNNTWPQEILDRPYEVLKGRADDDDEEDGEDEEDVDSEGEYSAESESDDDIEQNRIYWQIKDHQRVYLFLAVAVDDFDSLCTYQTIFGVSLKKRADMDDVLSFLTFLLFCGIWSLFIVGGYFVRRRVLRVTYIRQATGDKLEQAAWTIIYRYEKLIHSSAINNLFVNTQFDITGNMSAVAKSAYDKRRAELRMKKTHIMAQEQARFERLVKIYQKQNTK